MRRIAILLLALLLMLSLSVTAMAESSVTYQGAAKEFVFVPGTEEHPTDLFPSFKDVMPGDTLTEQITIKNKAANKVNVYLRSHGAQEDTEEFLSQLKLTVRRANNSAIFEAAANETAQLKDWVYLDTLLAGEEVTLDVTLEVPIELGNEYQNQIGYVNWEFSVEEFDAESSGNLPATGDNSNLLFYALLMIASFAILVILLLAAKRRKRS